MDEPLSNGLHENSLNFKRALDRIAQKYSKLQYGDRAIEVDLGNIQWALVFLAPPAGNVQTSALNNYIDLSRKQLDSLESKSLLGLNEESLNGQGVLGNSQLDHSYDDGVVDRTCVSTRGLAVEDDKVMSLLDESCRALSENELQPEDQDEELQISLNSKGSSLSLVELYPSMVSRIERAWHRQHVADAASSVLKRYRRFRQQPKRSSLNNTFDVTLRYTKRNPQTNKLLHKESSHSSVKRIRPEVTPEFVQQSTVTSLRGGQVQQRSPGKDRAFLREVPHTVRVMDFSKTAKPREISLNETFVVSELPQRQPQLGEQVSSHTASPSRLSYITAMDSLFREKSSFISSASTESVICAKEAPALKERPNFFGSPVRQSPSKSQVTNLSRSPYASLKSPQRCSLDHSFTELVTSRSLSMSQPSTPSRPVVQQRMLHPPGSHHSSQQQLRLLQSARRADGHPNLRRHLSFDSSLPSTVSPKKVDEDFIQLYHKFVCKNKSAFFNSLPCRLCARSSEGSKGHSSSSSSLAALALSPHRAVLWKRHRKLQDDSYPQSKRLRDECHTYSPGSKRCQNRMLKHLSPSELEPPHGALSFSPSKHRMQEPAACQEAWMSRCRAASADLSSLDSFEKKMLNGYSPRSWK